MQNFKIYRLSLELKETPTEDVAWDMVKEFYDHFDPQWAENELWFITNAAIGSDSEEFTALHRRNMLFSFENYKLLNQAVAYLLKKHTKKK